MRELDSFYDNWATDYVFIGWVCEYKNIAISDFMSASRGVDIFIARLLFTYIALYTKQNISDLWGVMKKTRATPYYYSRLIFNDRDSMVDGEINKFRTFLLNKGVRLPTKRQLRDKINNK